MSQPRRTGYLVPVLMVLTLLLAGAIGLFRSLSTEDTTPSLPTVPPETVSAAPSTPAPPSTSPTPTVMPTLPDDQALALLQRYNPELVLDSREQFPPVRVDVLFGDPDTALRRNGRNGDELASPDLDAADRLTLAFLGPQKYANGDEVQRDDMVSLYADHDDWVAWLKDHHPDKPVVYTRAVKDADGTVVLEYWWFSLFHDANPGTQDQALANQDDKEGDLTLAQVRLDGDDKPTEVTVTQHGKGATRPWAEVQHDGQHPVLYPSWGTHEVLFEAGRYRTTDVALDWNDGKGARITPDVLPLLAEPNVRWATWPGRLGDAETPCRWSGWPGPVVLPN